MNVFLSRRDAMYQSLQNNLTIFLKKPLLRDSRLIIPLLFGLGFQLYGGCGGKRLFLYRVVPCLEGT